MSYETVMVGLTAQMQAALPNRVVQRGMVLDPAGIRADDMAKGVLCLVATGGAGFWNFQGREADGGDMDVTLVGFVEAPEKAKPVEVEQLEFAVLEDVLSFCKGIEFGNELLAGLEPLSWRNSGGLETPNGWISIKLKVRWL
ncbi:MAG: hypothetical protein V4451_04660 [Pseudomonadota bacterium]